MTDQPIPDSESGAPSEETWKQAAIATFALLRRFSDFVEPRLTEDIPEELLDELMALAAVLMRLTADDLESSRV